MKAVFAGLMLLLAASLPLQCAGPRQLVRLEEDVLVGADAIRLSDLLPAGTSAEFMETAAATLLGRSPQPGTPRVLEAWQIREALATHADLLNQLDLPSRVTVRRAGWPLPRHAVYQAMVSFLAAGGWNKTDMPPRAGLEWPDMVSALVPDPDLKVSAASLNEREHALQLQMRCAQQVWCGTFLVQAPLPGALYAAPEKRIARSHARLRQEVLAQAGKPAILTRHKDGIRVSLSVVCLERGVLGQVIRVRDPASHRIFQGEVVGAGLLQLRF